MASVATGCDQCNGRSLRASRATAKDSPWQVHLRLTPSPVFAPTVGKVTACDEPARYEIRVASVLDGCWAAWFEGLEVSSDDAETVISGVLTDQSALHGVLARVCDLGLTLISLRRLGP
jgi:hypothetical protein